MEAVLEHLLRQNASLTRMLRRARDEVSEEEFAHAASASAPPIGWHMWHIARWSDRFQATLEDRDRPSEIWVKDSLAQALGFLPEQLGVLQLGMTMDPAVAQNLTKAIGKDRFGVYLDRVMERLSTGLAECDQSTLIAPRMTIREYAVVNGVIEYATPQQSTLLADTLFHLTHSARHMGSIEALRGLRS